MNGVTQKANIAKGQIFSNSLRNALMLSLVSEWKIDNASGTIVTDSWSGGSSGTLTGFTDTTAGYGDTHTSGWMSSVNCVSGTCLKFNGVDGYVNCGNQEAFKSLSRAYQDSTWSFWFNTNDGGEVIGKYQPFQFLIYEGKLSSFIYNGSNHLIGDPWQGNLTVNDGKWHYAVFVVDRDGYFTAYLDGIIDGSPYNISTHVAENWTETAFLYFGLRNSGSSIFTGLIDEVRIYNAIMPTSQIKDQYFGGLNNLFKNSSISKEEYLERMSSLALKD